MTYKVNKNQMILMKISQRGRLNNSRKNSDMLRSIIKHELV